MQKPTRALIVDDDKEICALLCSYLADFGIEARGVHDGAAMRRALAEQAPDVIILDLMLPGEDGLTLCRQLRANGNSPIIMLTARGEPADRVMGLELGADDYVTKPFDPRELVARVHTVLRRARGDGVVGGSGESEIVRFEGWTLDVGTRQLTTPRQVVVPLRGSGSRRAARWRRHSPTPPCCGSGTGRCPPRRRANPGPGRRGHQARRGRGTNRVSRWRRR